MSRRKTRKQRRQYFCEISNAPVAFGIAKMPDGGFVPLHQTLWNGYEWTQEHEV